MAFQRLGDFIILVDRDISVLCQNEFSDFFERNAGVLSKQNAREYQRLLGQVITIMIVSDIGRLQQPDRVIVLQCINGCVC